MQDSPAQQSEGGPPRAPWRVSIVNLMQAVGEANRSLEEYLEAHGAQTETIFAATLALEEVVTNVIKYAYCDDAEHAIFAEAEITAEEVLLRFTDDGRAFDPLCAKPPEIAPDCEDLPVGGLGVHIVKEFADRLEYQRTDEKNVLTVVFKLTPGS